MPRWWIDIHWLLLGYIHIKGDSFVYFSPLVKQNYNCMSVMSRLDFYQLVFLNKGLSWFLCCQLQKVSLTTALTKPKSIHHRSLNYRKCSLQDCTLILKFCCSYTFLAGDTHVIFFCFIFLASAHFFCSWFIHCPKVLAKGFIFYFICIWSSNFFSLLESVLLPADFWACGTISIFKPVASLFDLVFPLCNFCQYLHALPPNDCKAVCH